MATRDACDGHDDKVNEHAAKENASAEFRGEAQSGVSPQLERSRQATQAAWQRLEAEFGLLDISEVSVILQGTGAESGPQLPLPTGLLGVKLGPSLVYPGFQFDRESGAVLAVIRTLLAVAADNDWSNESLALWLISPTTSFPAEDRPVDHLIAEPESVIAAARNDFESRW